MAFFKALKGDKASVDRCLSAIKKACSTELWLDSLIESSEKKGTIDSSQNVLLHWWKRFKETDINFQYFNKFKDEASYYYEDSNGRMLHISDSHVYHYNGFPESLINELEGCSHDELYDLIETKISQFINEDDFELSITCINNK